MPDAAAVEPPKSSVLINIDKSSQEMTVFVDGVELYTWPVSTGIRGYSTPSGTYTTTSMNEIWYSKQWDNAPMPHAIFFTKKGHAIHGTLETKKLGRAASHGCVRLSPDNASTLFKLVKATGLENTQVVLNGETPGGEAKVASPEYGRRPQGYPPWFMPGEGFLPPSRRRSGVACSGSGGFSPTDRKATMRPAAIIVRAALAPAATERSIRHCRREIIDVGVARQAPFVGERVVDHARRVGMGEAGAPKRASQLLGRDEAVPIVGAERQPAQDQLGADNGERIGLQRAVERRERS